MILQGSLNDTLNKSNSLSPDEFTDFEGLQVYLVQAIEELTEISCLIERWVNYHESESILTEAQLEEKKLEHEKNIAQAKTNIINAL